MKNFNLFFLIFFLFSCSDNDIENDMQNWCNCVKISKQNENIKDSCNQIMIDISLKYEYDPESVDVIRRYVKTCR